MKKTQKEEVAKLFDNIEKVISEIDRLFKNYNRNIQAFTVDYDGPTDGIYCNYVPYVNDIGYAVSDDLLIVSETSQQDLQKLKDYLDKNKIRSRCSYEWQVGWGYSEE